MTIYVDMTDTFMSGWGRADGLINKLVFICDTPDEADAVVANAKRRSDTKNVGASSTPPQYFHKRWRDTGADYVTGRYYVQIKTRDDYPNWYQPGAF